MLLSPDWITPDWPLPPGVRSVCTTRAGGTSAAPYDSLNLGDHVGDAPYAVDANRRLFERAIGARPAFLRQIHGSAVARLDAGGPDTVEADGCVSAVAGQVCTIMVADCLPVLFCTADGLAVAAAHAGWRGLAGDRPGSGILEATFHALCLEVQAQRSSIAINSIASGTQAWLGPCIGPTAFEVGPDVHAAFCAADANAASAFTALAGGKYLASLAGLARQRLAALGLTRIYGNDGSDAWCTFRQPSRFFSHRRDALRLGGTGRMAAAIWKI